ncbi:MAG: thiol reductant ABC exporter subunit CydC [Sporomusaceae bacterium]|nr:thiol reductant ABC exporter subunit CydC [Sporomusaceae bacterium]
MKTFIRLLKIIGSAWLTMLIAAVFGCLTIGSNMGLLGVSAYLIASAALHPSISELSAAIVGVRFFGIVRAVFRYLERYISHDATFRLLGTIRVWFYAKIERLAPARLMEWQSGELFSAIVGDVETLKEFYLRVLAPPFIGIVVLSAACLFLSQYSMSFVYLLMGAFLMAGVLLPILVQTIQKNSASELVAVRSELKAQLVDSMTGIVELAAFGQTERQAQRIDHIHQRLLYLQSKVSKLSGLIDTFGLLIVNSTVWLTLWLAIPLVHSKQIEGVYLAVLVLIVQSSFEAVLPLPLAVHYLAESMAAARRLFAIVDTEPAVPEVDDGIHNASNISIKVENLSFRYSPEGPFVLNNIHFTVSAGQRVAIVGPSGSGKSTLLHLFLRFWNYSQGSIYLGKSELKKYDAHWLRSQFGVVSQQTHLFNASIRDNILLARPDASEDQFDQAIKHAELENFIGKLPQGYDTMVGQNGYALSGGERQRIAIARALLKNAPILILDEPTVGLDAVTEQLVMATIEKLMAGRTTIMITHRLTGLHTMDEILVLSSGRIVEQGQQAELLANKQLFYQLWRLQHDVL